MTIDASGGVQPADDAGTHPCSVTNEQALRTLRLRRAELGESTSALEQALAAPAPGRVAAWAERVHVALVELSGDFRDHVDIAEGPGGVYRAVVSPRRGCPTRWLTCVRSTPTPTTSSRACSALAVPPAPRTSTASRSWERR